MSGVFFPLVSASRYTHSVPSISLKVNTPHYQAHLWVLLTGILDDMFLSLYT